MAYCERSDVEMVFGAANVAAWADLDNDADADKIEERIEWACDEATDRIDNRLRGGIYAVPFDTVPRTVTTIAARIAGVTLYDGRGVVDKETEDQMAPHRKLVERSLDEITQGVIRLDAAEVSRRYPTVISMD